MSHNKNCILLFHFSLCLLSVNQSLYPRMQLFVLLLANLKEQLYNKKISLMVLVGNICCKRFIASKLLQRHQTKKRLILSVVHKIAQESTVSPFEDCTLLWLLWRDSCCRVIMNHFG